MLEREVEKAVVDYAKSRGVIALKLEGPHDTGKPDRALFYRGRCMFMEMKRPGEKPTKLQQSWLDRFTEAGFDAVCIDNIGKGKTKVDQFLAEDDIYSDL